MISRGFSNIDVAVLYITPHKNTDCPLLLLISRQQPAEVLTSLGLILGSRKFFPFVYLKQTVASPQ